MKSKKAKYIGIGCLTAVLALVIVLGICMAFRKTPVSGNETCSGHEWGEGIIVTEATCTHEGVERFTCTKCGTAKTVSLERKEHAAIGDWEHDTSGHWNICETCGGVYAEASHKWARIATEDVSAKTMYTCMICGAVTDQKPTEKLAVSTPVYTSVEIATMAREENIDYLFLPLLDGSNFTVENTGKQKISQKWARTELGNSVLLSVPTNAEIITVKPTEILSKEELKRLAAAGNTEITAQMTVELTGGKWWGGSILVKAPWASSVWSTDKFQNNIAGPLKLKFSIAEAIENYDKICSEGLFQISYANQAYDSYTINFSAFKVTTDHEWGNEWKKDRTNHYHVCTVCGAMKDVTGHAYAGTNNCSVCGPLNVAVFTPAANGSNFTTDTTGDKKITGKKAAGDSDNVVVLEVPKGAGTITIKPSDMKSREELQRLLKEGYSEIKVSFTMELTGGEWWPGKVTLTTPWTGKIYTTSDFRNNVAGPITLKYALRDLIANYQNMAEEGLLSVAFDNQAHDTYEISLSAFEAATDHEWNSKWEQDETKHYHVCNICGERKDESNHKWTDDMQICSVCGVVHRYLFRPELDASNFTVKSTGGQTIKIQSAETALGNTIVLPVPQKAETIVLTPNAIKDKEALQEMAAAGFTEITAQFTLTLTGGNWWGGTVTVSTPWSAKTYSASTVNNVAGPIKLKFALADVIANYDKVCTEGLLKVNYGNQYWDTYDINFTAFEIVGDHEWADAWSKDAKNHYHVCEVCGAHSDEAAHDWTGEWQTDSSVHWHVCTVCGMEESKVSHTIDKTVWENDINKHWHVCADCNCKLEEGSHNWQYDDGYTSAQCKDCGLRVTEGITTYTVKHLLQNASGDYDVKDTENLKAVAGSIALFTVKEYAGYQVSSTPDNVTVNADGATVVEIKYDYVTPEFYDTYISNTDKTVVVGAAYSIRAENLAGRTVMWSTDGTHWSKNQPKFVSPGTYKIYHKYAALNGQMVEGSNTLTIKYFMNDLGTIGGVKVTYLNSAGAAGESSGANQFGGSVADGNRNFAAWIPQWTKSGSLAFYAPLQITKEQIKALLDDGTTILSITISQSGMNDAPWWGLTNTVSADWTTTTQTVSHTEGYKELKFSLQDLYAHYDEIANGTMAFFKFAIKGLDVNDGGVWVDGKGWISSSYDIRIKDIVLKAETAQTTENCYINDFKTADGIKVTYLNSGGVAGSCSGADRFGNDDDGIRFVAWIPQWTKSQSLQFYVPLQMSKERVKAFLDKGYTDLSVTISQSYMNDDPWWGLTNTVSADWTTAAQTVSHSEGYKELKFSLQDFYNHYDEIANGTMPLLKFAIGGLNAGDGGFWVDGKGWISSSYDIKIKNIMVK